MNNMRLVILLLGSTLLVSVLAIAGLAALGAAIPDVLQNVAVGSLTGLAGVLARKDDTPTGAGMHRG